MQPDALLARLNIKVVPALVPVWVCVIEKGFAVQRLMQIDKKVNQIRKINRPQFATRIGVAQSPFAFGHAIQDVVLGPGVWLKGEGWRAQRIINEMPV